MNLCDKHMVSSSSLCKNKEALASNSGGKMKVNIPCILCKSNTSLLNMTLICFSCRVSDILSLSLAFLSFGNLFASYSITPVVIMTFDPILCQTQPNFRVVSSICSREIIFAKSNFLYLCDPLCNNLEPLLSFWDILCFVSMMWETLGPSFEGSLPLDLNSYPRKWSRNSLSVPWSLHVSMANSSCSTIGLHHWPSIEWFCECSTSAHLFTLVDCVGVPWGPLSLLVVSLIPVNGLHHWLVIRWFSIMFDLYMSIHMIEFVY